MRLKETSEWKKSAGQPVSSVSPEGLQGNAGSSVGPCVGLTTPSCRFLPELRARLGESQTPCKWTQSIRVICPPPGRWLFRGILSTTMGEKAAWHTCPQMLTWHFLWPKDTPSGPTALHLGPQVQKMVSLK